jgi:arylsulfatase A-like enzyme
MGFHEWLSHDNFFELNPSLSRNGQPPEVVKGESSEILVTEAIAFMERSRQDEAKKRQPFLTVVWFGSPHEPYSGLPEDLSIYDQLPGKYSEKKVSLTSNETGRNVTRTQGEVLRERYAEITAMDRSIGKLRKYLRESGQRENTLLFYCGDNGTSSDGLLKSPHRGHKGQVYEGGTLVPGLVEWPVKIKQSMASNVHACTSDILPTVASIVKQELSARPLDGIDLTKILEGELPTRPQPLCFWEFDSKRYQQEKPQGYIAASLQEGTTPLVKLAGGKATRNFVNYRHPSIQPDDTKGPRAIIDGQYKLVVHDKGGKSKEELFDLAADSGETTDIAEKHPDRVASLSAKLAQWQSSVLNSLMGRDY